MNMSDKGDRDRKVVTLYKSGKNVSEIQEEVAVSRPTIRSILRKEGVYEKGRSKIAPLAKKIISLYRQGKGCREISRLLGISQPSVTRILQINNIEIRQQKKYVYNEDYFNKIETQEQAYWLGFLFADGGIYLPSKKKKQYCLKVSLSSKDAYHLKSFASILAQDLHIVTSSQKYKNYVSLYVNNVKIVSDLVGHGCVPRKSKILKFPKHIENDLLRHFIRGYMDGDGWITIEQKTGRLRLGLLGTKDMLDNIMNVLNFVIGIPKVQCISKSNIYMLSVGHQQFNEPLYDFLYTGATCFLERKRNIFIEYLTNSVHASSRSLSLN
jgi:intein-encoded DNA endonuclease-like protein